MPVEPSRNPSTALSRALKLFTPLPELVGDRHMSAVVLDVLFGVLFAYLLQRHSPYWAERICSLHRQVNCERLPSSLKWLMGYPAGLKLNSDLSKFIGELYLWLLSSWNGKFAQYVLPSMPIIVQCIAASGLAGWHCLVMTLSVGARVLFFPWESFYQLSARLFSAEITFILSLWNLFKGKKWNVLHNRLDSADYSLDQLLLGTVIFSTMMFLLPTIVAYYLLFTLIKIAAASVQCALHLLLVPVKIGALGACETQWHLVPAGPPAVAKLVSKTLADGSELLEETLASRPFFTLTPSHRPLSRMANSITSNIRSAFSTHFGGAFWASLVSGKKA